MLQQAHTRVRGGPRNDDCGSWSPVIRKAVSERYYRFLTGQSVDRLPDVEFGYWPQTVRRWLREGLPRSLEEW